MITLAGCGGGGGGGTTTGAEATRTIRGNGFAFSAPAGWSSRVSPVGASTSPGKGSDTIATVTVFRLVRPFRPVLWPGAAKELDSVAERLAHDLRGTVDSRRTIREGIRQYELSYTRDGTAFRERIRFVLHGRREYELFCRWQRSGGEPEACALLLESFRLS